MLLNELYGKRGSQPGGNHRYKPFELRKQYIEQILHCKGSAVQHEHNTELSQVIKGRMIESCY